MFVWMILKSSKGRLPSLFCIAFWVLIPPILRDDRRFMFALFGDNWKILDDLLGGDCNRCVLLNAPGWLWSRVCHVFTSLTFVGLSIVLFDRCLINWSLLEAEVRSLFRLLSALIEAITAWTFPSFGFLFSSDLVPASCWLFWVLFRNGSLPRRTYIKRIIMNVLQISKSYYHMIYYIMNINNISL